MDTLEFVGDVTGRLRAIKIVEGFRDKRKRSTPPPQPRRRSRRSLRCWPWVSAPNMAGCLPTWACSSIGAATLPATKIL